MINKAKERGWNIEQWLKYRTPMSTENRIKTLKRMYGGVCHSCQALPLYKVFYKVENCTLVEYWCEKHMNEFV